MENKRNLLKLVLALATISNTLSEDIEKEKKLEIITQVYDNSFIEYILSKHSEIKEADDDLIFCLVSLGLIRNILKDEDSTKKKLERISVIVNDKAILNIIKENQ